LGFQPKAFNGYGKSSDYGNFYGKSSDYGGTYGGYGYADSRTRGGAKNGGYGSSSNYG
jgi:hypothetical protein